ncbi:hypothetical protein FHR99_000659 [Litorivivens lipolytica]|uniref:DUF1289 domain-containing protein n=1 Tax=Litorivivens lipolytica TaxID=1524264 RepID=A0A7W4W3E4_9GAMM|nr:hypothetical protein [Litorivivens lipolytica]
MSPPPARQNVLPRVTTPCIGVCSTALGDSVCRGCKRFSHEVIDWNGYNEEQKQAIDRRLDDFLSQVVGNKLRIVDAGLLEWQMQVQQIRFKPHKRPEVWAFALLKAGAAQIKDPAEFGLAIDAQYRDVPLTQLRDMIDREFYILSEAHYDRYMKVV